MIQLSLGYPEVTSSILVGGNFLKFSLLFLSFYVFDINTSFQALRFLFIIKGIEGDFSASAYPKK